jgi:hypothetical protein
VIWLMTVAVFAFLFGQTGRWQLLMLAAASGAIVYMMYWVVRMRIIMARPEYELEMATGQIFTPALRIEKFVTGILIPIAAAILLREMMAF